MLYALGFLVLILVVLGIWLVRLSMAYAHRRRNPDALPVDPEAQFREVTDRFFRGPRQDSSAESTTPARTRRCDEGAVVRMTSESTAGLPAYGAASLPVPPDRVYQPSRVSIRPDQTTVILMGLPEIPPPKYSAVANETSPPATTSATR